VEGTALNADRVAATFLVNQLRVSAGGSAQGSTSEEDSLDGGTPQTSGSASGATGPASAPTVAESPGAFAGNVAQLGIFPRTGPLACTEPIMLTVIIFVALLPCALVFSVCFKPSTNFDTHLNVPLWRSSLMKHGWLNLIPCHGECAVIHVVQLFCHVIGLLGVCALINFVASPSGSGGMVAFWCAVIIPILVVGPGIQTLLSFYSWTYLATLYSIIVFAVFG
jgi:hypothetical protein